MATPLNTPPDHIKRKMERALTNVYCDLDRLITEVWGTAYENGYNIGWDRGYSDAKADLGDKPREAYNG
jgi:hypothetical protein